MFIKHMFDTLHEFQPSTNFFEPMRMLILELFALILWNKEPEKWSSSTFIPFDSMSFFSLSTSPTFITPKYFSEVLSANSPLAFFIRYSFNFPLPPNILL